MSVCVRICVCVRACVRACVCVCDEKNAWELTQQASEDSHVQEK